MTREEKKNKMRSFTRVQTTRRLGSWRITRNIVIVSRKSGDLALLDSSQTPWSRCNIRFHFDRTVKRIGSEKNRNVARLAERKSCFCLIARELVTISRDKLSNSWIHCHLVHSGHVTNFLNYSSVVMWHTRYFVWKFKAWHEKTLGIKERVTRI